MAIIKSRRAPMRAAFPFPSFSTIPTLDEMENRLRKAFESPTFEGDFLTEPFGFMPATEVVELADKMVVTTELPGLEKKDVEITVEDGVLTIRGEKVEERKEEEGKKYHLFERNYGSFQRSFTLPRTIDAAKISADFDKGVLKVFMPKTAEAATKGRKIEIGVK